MNTPMGVVRPTQNKPIVTTASISVLMAVTTAGSTEVISTSASPTA